MFWEIFLSLCQQKGESPNAVAKKLSISSGAVTFWKKGKVPHHGTLLKIAEYFGVSVDFLLGKSIEADSEGKQELFDLIDQMDEDQLQQLEDYVDFLVDKKKKRGGDAH